jgi:hypothetical protein
VRLLGWLAGFAIGYLATLTVSVIIMPELGPVRTLMLVAGSLAGLALKAWRRRGAAGPDCRAAGSPDDGPWRWRGDGLGA